jgi:hypothetical protein
MGTQQRIAAAVNLAAAYADRADRAWVIDQMVRALLGRRYDDWVADYRTGGGDGGVEIRQWDEGEPPEPLQLSLLNWAA